MPTPAHSIARLRSIQFLAEEALRIADEDGLGAVAIRLSETLDRVRDELDALAQIDKAADSRID